jgi:hypothetical protein
VAHVGPDAGVRQHKALRAWGAAGFECHKRSLVDIRFNERSLLQAVASTGGRFYRRSLLQAVAFTGGRFYRRSLLQAVASTSGRLNQRSLVGPDESGSVRP